MIKIIVYDQQWGKPKHAYILYRLLVDVWGMVVICILRAKPEGCKLLQYCDWPIYNNLLIIPLWSWSLSGVKGYISSGEMFFLMRAVPSSLTRLVSEGIIHKLFKDIYYIYITRMWSKKIILVAAAWFKCQTLPFPLPWMKPIIIIH